MKSSTKAESARARSKSKYFAVLFLVALLILLGCVWQFSKRRKTTASTKPTTASTPLHTPAEAVDFAKALYVFYLPLKQQTYKEVGDNQNVEPAAVQVVRGSKDLLAKDLYATILTDYMTEYQASGKVTKDSVVCSGITSATPSAKLASSTSTSTIVNVTLTTTEGTIKKIPVTVDLAELKATKIDCSKAS